MAEPMILQDFIEMNPNNLFGGMAEHFFCLSLQIHNLKNKTRKSKHSCKILSELEYFTMIQ